MPGIPEADDTNVSRSQLLAHWEAFGFRSVDDVDHYETCRSVELIAIT